MNVKSQPPIHHHIDGPRRRVSMSGEMNAKTAPALTVLLRRICADFGELELDLRGVTFMDTAGVRALLNAKAICAEHCAELVLIPPSPAAGARRHRWLAHGERRRS